MRPLWKLGIVSFSFLTSTLAKVFPNIANALAAFSAFHAASITSKEAYPSAKGTARHKEPSASIL